MESSLSGLQEELFTEPSVYLSFRFLPYLSKMPTDLASTNASSILPLLGGVKPEFCAKSYQPDNTPFLQPWFITVSDLEAPPDNFTTSQLTTRHALTFS